MGFFEKKLKLLWVALGAITVITITAQDTVGGETIFLTEGMNDYILERQLGNYLPFDSDITTIICIGWTGNKVTIKLTDAEAYGDILAAVALVYYPQLGRFYPIWGTLYSKKSEDSFTLTIPAGPPAIVVFLTTGYFSPSTGENPYSYKISLSFPR